jgi:hypothetical protein
MKISPPCYVRVIRVLDEIRDGIRDIAGRRESDAVNEAVDIDFIQSQVALGAYDWEDCKRLFEGLLCIIRRVQAPKRDAETNQKWVVLAAGMSESDIDQAVMVCKVLEFLLDRVNALRIDAANARYANEWMAYFVAEMVSYYIFV